MMISKPNVCNAWYSSIASVLWLFLAVQRKTTLPLLKNLEIKAASLANLPWQFWANWFVFCFCQNVRLRTYSLQVINIWPMIQLSHGSGCFARIAFADLQTSGLCFSQMYVERWTNVWSMVIHGMHACGCRSIVWIRQNFVEFCKKRQNDVSTIGRLAAKCFLGILFVLQHCHCVGLGCFVVSRQPSSWWIQAASLDIGHVLLYCRSRIQA